jgi:hypothetical protein
MRYELVAHYWMRDPRTLSDLPTLSHTRYRATTLLEAGAEEVEIWAVDGDNRRRLDVLRRKSGDELWTCN